MKIIVLHDRFSNEPIIIRMDAITAIKKETYEVENSKEEYSTVNVSQVFFEVNEHIDVVMAKIKNAERQG